MNKNGKQKESRLKELDSEAELLRNSTDRLMKVVEYYVSEAHNDDTSLEKIIEILIATTYINNYIVNNKINVFDYLKSIDFE